MNFSDTIVAPATSSGMSAIAVIRVSGRDALAITSKVFTGKDLTQVASHTLHYGFITNLAKDEVIDEVMVAVLRSPKSYTTENTAEISCHGSPFIVEKIVQTLLSAGARLAEPGEFSLRAFMNGRINLAQAEAVADLIAAENDWQHKVAIQQMRGGFINDLQTLRQQLVDYTALVELELDFGEEDVEFAKREQLIAFIIRFQEHLDKLIESFQTGNAIKNGIPVAIVGKPNAGKSTLLNTLLNEERAIVSDIAGTTRDIIEEVMQYKGFAFRFIDTAGIRPTTDTIESIGVQKALQKARSAQMVLYLFDVNTTHPHDLQKEMAQLQLTESLIVPVANKIDLASWEKTAAFAHFPRIQFISAANRFNIEMLKESLYEFFVRNTRLPGNFTPVTNLRHLEAMVNVRTALRKAQTGLENKVSGELIAFDLREALHYLGTIAGEVGSEEILGSIFSRFCIGK